MIARLGQAPRHLRPVRYANAAPSRYERRRPARKEIVGVDEHGAPRVVRHGDIVNLLRQLESAEVDFIKTENLCTFDSEAGYALGQGQ